MVAEKGHPPARSLDWPPRRSRGQCIIVKVVDIAT